MKKIILLSLTTLLLSGCADKQQYEQAIFEQLQSEKDLKDYNIDPQTMTECIVELTSKKMPGLFPFDPARLMAFRNYAQMLNLTKSENPKKTLEELRTSFGSPKALSEAHSNYTESTMNCMSSIIMNTEEKEVDKG